MISEAQLGELLRKIDALSRRVRDLEAGLVVAAGTSVASVSGTAPITSSGGSTPAIAITAATASVAGSMSAADKAKEDAYPAVSGLTTGQALRATAAGAVAFGAIDLSNVNAITGTLPATHVGAIAARYTTTAGQSISHGTLTIIDFGTLVVDTDSRVTTGANWKFTAGFATNYRVSASILFTSRAWVVGNVCQLALYKNGSLYAYLQRTDDSNGTINAIARGTATISLAVGDYIDVRLYQETGSALTLNSSATVNYIDIEAI